METKLINAPLIINLKPWLFGLNTLVFFPLLSLLLWRLGISSMDIAGGMGLVLSIFLSAFFFKGTDFHLTVQRAFELYIILVFSIILTVLYYFRLNFEFVDIHCPTNLLGFVSQLRRGHFPVSFLAFPLFPANYHAGFALITGYLSRWFGIEEYSALRFLSIIAFFYVALGLQFFFLSVRSTWKIIVGILLFFFSFNFPMSLLFPHTPVPDWFKATSVFDYFRSNSWPLADLTLVLMLFYFWQKSLTVKNMLVFACYTLLLAIFNAVIHSLVLVTVIVAVLYEIVYVPTSRKYWFENRGRKLVLLVGLLLLVKILTLIIPSAFMLGEHYRSVKVGYAFLRADYLTNLKCYLFQCGLLPWLSLSVAIPLLIKRKGSPLLRGIALLFIIAFFFPIIFCLKGITIWDNYHKFLLSGYLAGSVLVVISWIKAKGITAHLLTIGVVLTLLISAPSAKNMFDYQTSRYPVPAYDADNNGIIQFLKTQPADTELLPYAKEGYFFCSAYTEVAAASGIFAKDGYCFWFFTLSNRTENGFTHQQNWWKTPESFKQELTQSNNGHLFIIVKQEFIKDFNQELLASHLATAGTWKRIEFKNFILIQPEA